MISSLVLMWSMFAVNLNVTSPEPQAEISQNCQEFEAVLGVADQNP